MTKETIDIILPTYLPNLNLIKRAIDSIIDQEYTDWILFLVQDGNDCDMQSLVNSYNDARIKYFEIAHCGKAAALNYALEQGNSKYIAYQDDDDIWYPIHLKECITYMKDNDAKFVHTDAYEVFITVTDKNEFQETSRQKLHGGLLTDLTLMAISHINVIHERELLHKAGIYDVSLQFYIDWDMFQRLAKQTKHHHIPKYTCEHYIFTNMEGLNINTISSANYNNPKLKEEKLREMYIKSFDLLTVDNYLLLLNNVYVTFQKEHQIGELKEELKQQNEEMKQKNEELNQLYCSKSWRVTKPLRMILKLFKKD